MSQERKALDAAAISVMVLLTALWGFQQVTIKVIAADVSLVMQAAIRSMVATLLLLAWSRLTKESLWGRDGTLAARLGAGLLFAFEFVFIYGGLGYTNASRMSVFVYLAPPLTALGVHFFVPGERLVLGQWRGDLCGLAAAVLWAATTSATKTLSRRWCSRASPTRGSSWRSRAISPGSGC